MPVPPTHLASAAIPLAALAGVSAALAIAGLAEAARQRPGSDAAARPSGARPRRSGRAVRLTGLVRLLARLLGRPAPAPRDLQARLDAAGVDATATDVMALKTGAALVGAFVALPAASLAPGRLGPVVLLAGPVAGFLVPDAVLRRRARTRAAQLALELPDVAELLRVAVGAGLPPTRALAEVGRRHPGVLAAELQTVAGQSALGVPHDATLDHLRRRAPVPGVLQLTSALRRAHAHGAPLDEALAAIAVDARAERARRLRDRAARAAPQIQLVVALLLVPAVLLLVAAGLAAALL